MGIMEKNIDTTTITGPYRSASRTRDCTNAFGYYRGLNKYQYDCSIFLV